MPAVGVPHNYNLRSADDIDRDQVETEETVEGISTPSNMAGAFKLDMFRGDGTDKVEDFLKRFEQYVNIVQIKKEQQLDVLLYHLEGRARWYLDTVSPQPKTVDEAKVALTTKFKQDVTVRLNVFSMKKMEAESISDFMYRLEKDTHHMNLPENVRVKIALEGLDPHICSAISSHGPKTLDEVRVLAGRVETTPPPPVAAATADPSQNPLAEIMAMMREMMTERTPPRQERPIGRPYPSNQRPQQQQQQQPQRQQQQNERSCMRCGDILGMIPKLLLWTFLLSLMISLVSSNPAYTSRLNYGMVFEKQPQLYLAQETWFHTFEIDLPVDLNMIEISGCTHDHQTCLVVNQVLSEINKIRKNTKHTLDSALTAIEQLIPERAHMPKSRGKRALFGFIGQISKTAFGTATMDDVNLLARHINTLKNQESKLIKSVQQHENHLSSFIQASDERMSNLRSGIEQNHMAITHIHTQLQGSFQTLENSIITMNKIMARQIEQSQKWEWVLNELIAGIFSLVEGKLSPAIIPVNKMEQAVKGIKSILHNKYPGFHLNIPHPVDAYKTNKFVYTRNGSKLYIAVKFQMSPFQRPLSLYKILSYPVPINSTSNHATQLLNVPEYFAVTENKQYYATFSSAEFIACSKSFHWSCKFNKVLSPATHESCIMSIFQNDKALIKKHCDFRFLINHLFSQIIEISKSEILVYQSDLLEFDCKNGKRMIKGCNFCKLVVPCECSISTSQMYLSPRLASCHNKTQNITKLHPINLALLQQFFDTPTLSNMSGDSLFEDMPEIDVPQFQLYNHTMSNVLADDTKKHLSLKKMANKAKQDAVIFQSLTEPLLNGEIILDQGGLSTQDILLYATMLAVAACIFIIGFMALKLRKTLIMLSVMQNVPTHVKASVVPSFRYIDTNTPAPTTEINILEQLQLSWDHAIFFITCCTLISVILMITYLICKSRSKKTTLMLELTCGDVCVMIPLKSLPLCPSYWSVQLPASIELVKVTGTFRPKLEIKWSDIKYKTS